jgi:hypothetical protein
MSRFDKYDPYDGGFRAKLNAAIVAADAGKIRAVTINSSGRVVIGGTLADIRGVICPTEAMAAGAPIDVMTDGEIGDATETAGTAFTGGAVIYGHADGTVDDTITTGKALGWTVEVDRAIFRSSNLV